MRVVKARVEVHPDSQSADAAHCADLRTEAGSHTNCTLANEVYDAIPLVFRKPRVEFRLNFVFIVMHNVAVVDGVV